MATAKFGGVRSCGGNDSDHLELADVNNSGNIAEDILDTDLILRSFGISDAYTQAPNFSQSHISPAGMACTAHANLQGQGHNHSGFSGGHFQNGGSIGANVHQISSFAVPLHTTASSNSKIEALQTSTNTSNTSTGGYATLAASNSQTGRQNIPNNGQSKFLAESSIPNGGEEIKADENLNQFFDLLSSDKDLKSGRLDTETPCSSDSVARIQREHGGILLPSEHHVSTLHHRTNQIGLGVHALEALLQSDLAQIVPVQINVPEVTNDRGIPSSVYPSIPNRGTTSVFTVPTGCTSFTVPSGCTGFSVPGSSSQPAFTVPSGGQGSAFNLPAGGQGSPFTIPAGGQGSAFTVPRNPDPNSRLLGTRGQLSPSTSVPNALLANLSQTPCIASNGDRPTLNVISSMPLMNPASTLAAPVPLVLNPSTLAPVLASNTLVSPIITSTGQQVRDVPMMFPATLEQRTIIKGVRSINKNTNSTSPPGVTRISPRSSQVGSLSEIKQEGLQEQTGIMDVDSLGMIQSILSFDTLPGSLFATDGHEQAFHLSQQHQPSMSHYLSNSNISSIEEKPVFSPPLSSPSTSGSNQILQGFPDQRPTTSSIATETDTLMTAWKNEDYSPQTTPYGTPRPSPQSTPPPAQFADYSNARGNDTRSFKRSGRSTPTGKRSRPQTPSTYMSDGEMSDGSGSASSGYVVSNRDRIESGGGSAPTPRETKAANTNKLEDMEDEDKYNKRKRPGADNERKDYGGPGGRRDPIKNMLEQLQTIIPHIGNPNEEKVSHAGLLVEGSDYIRSLMRENNTLQENIEVMKARVEDLNKEIEDSQERLPEHGSQSIHKILSDKGKSIPDMFADHVRHRTQEDWRYWVFTSIMGHFVHTFAQEVSNISPREMERTSQEWLQERMSLQQLRKDAFRKLAKLCAKTSIMEDASKLPEEARGFVALPDPEGENKEETEELNPPAFRNNV